MFWASGTIIFDQTMHCACMPVNASSALENQGMTLSILDAILPYIKTLPERHFHAHVLP